MKFIFDFDDVLFHNTEQFKEYMYKCLEEVGVSRQIALGYYKGVREKGFTLKKFIHAVLTGEKINNIRAEELCEKIMMECKNFVNLDLLSFVKKMGKSNCYLVTHGVKDYQLEKIGRAGIAPFFSDIITVQESKKKSVEKICFRHEDEEVFFIDDKMKRFEDLDYKKYPNLKPILYTGQNISDILK